MDEPGPQRGNGGRGGRPTRWFQWRCQIRSSMDPMERTKLCLRISAWTKRPDRPSRTGIQGLPLCYYQWLLHSQPGHSCRWVTCCVQWSNMRPSSVRPQSFHLLWLIYISALVEAHVSISHRYWAYRYRDCPRGSLSKVAVRSRWILLKSKNRH